MSRSVSLGTIDGERSITQLPTDRGLTIAHPAHGCPVPIEIRPYVGTPLAADVAHKTRLKIGQANVVGPAVRTDSLRVAPMIVGAIDQDAANALFAQFGEGDLL